MGKVQDFRRLLSEQERLDLQHFLPRPEAVKIYSSLAPDKNSVRQSASESIEQAVGREARHRRRDKLGAPLKITQAQWLAFGRGAALPEVIEIEIEVRLLILAGELGVDIFAMDEDWREVTARRLTMRLLTGHGSDRRRFPDWLLGDENTRAPKNFPYNGPLRVVHPSRRRRKVTESELDKVETVLAAERVHGTAHSVALENAGFEKGRIKELLGARKRRRQKRGKADTRGGLSDRK